MKKQTRLHCRENCQNFQFTKTVKVVSKKQPAQRRHNNALPNGARLSNAAGVGPAKGHLRGKWGGSWKRCAIILIQNAADRPPAAASPGRPKRPWRKTPRLARSDRLGKNCPYAFVIVAEGTLETQSGGGRRPSRCILIDEKG